MLRSSDITLDYLSTALTWADTCLDWTVASGVIPNLMKSSQWSLLTADARQMQVLQANDAATSALQQSIGN